MTQSPRSGEAAPSSTSVGSVPAQNGRHDAAAGYGESTPWTSPSRATGGGAEQASPDAPTGSVPTVKPERTAAAAPARGRATRARGPRRARLQLRHINPWTVLKFSCVLAIALFFVWLIVVGVLYGVLDAAGVVGKINNAYTTLKGDGAKAPITATLVFGSAAIIGVVNIILFIALSTVGSVIYNLCADLVGGVEVTLSER